ncbi:hypothetical protein NKG05_16065 [Oerskovia sp. M15]
MAGLPVVALALLFAVAAAALVGADVVRSRRTRRATCSTRRSRTSARRRSWGPPGRARPGVHLLPGRRHPPAELDRHPGVLIAVAPFGTAVVLLVVRAIGELTWPRPRARSGPRRSPAGACAPWASGACRCSSRPWRPPPSDS